jgi:lactoylglutathione lyase
MIQRLAHLCFKTDRLDRMIHFYRDQLGLRIKFTLNDAEGSAFGYYFACGGRTFVELFDQKGAARQWGGGVVALTTPPDATYQHFCLEVKNLAAFRRRLVARRLAVTAITTGMDGSRQCWLKDPDGNSIELMEYTPQSLQLRRPARRYRRATG